MSTPHDTRNTDRIARLNTASVRRVIEPDVEITGHVTKRQVLPDDLLSIAGLDVPLSADQRATLSREELASVVRFGVLFEAILMSGFAYRLALSDDVTDERVTYALHEIGEESRHSRLFVRLLDELAPVQRNPFSGPIAAGIRGQSLPFLFRRPATLDAFVLAGEEIPDLLQKQAAEHPETDDHVRAVSRYHRLEEARHIAFARMTVGEHYRHTTWTDRFAVRWVVPIGIVAMFDTIVQPLVYATVGLPPLGTWRRARRQPRRVAMRRSCVRAVLAHLLDAGVFARGRIPLAWRHVAGVNRHGDPLDAGAHP